MREQFRLSISCSGQAFADDRSGELSRLLRETANHIDSLGISQGSLKDINGNRCGSFGVVAGGTEHYSFTAQQAAAVRAFLKRRLINLAAGERDAYPLAEALRVMAVHDDDLAARLIARHER